MSKMLLVSLLSHFKTEEMSKRKGKKEYKLRTDIHINLMLINISMLKNKKFIKNGHLKKS